MRELARSDPVRPQDRWTRKLDEVVWPKRRGVFGRYGWVRRGFDPDEPRDEQGRWTSGGGSSGEQGELWPGKFPKSRDKKKINSVADFEKDKVHVNTTKPEKFLEAWNDVVGIEPGEFHEQFTGGLKSTMTINHAYNEIQGDVITNKFQIDGKILDENDRAIGTYTRVIDLKNNAAESSYFALNSGAQGKGEGKQMLAANVKMYQDLGLDKVEVHANIDVGGYAWAKYGYVPTEDSWDTLRGDLREKLNRGVGGGRGEGYTPEEWAMMSSDNQESVYDNWKEATHDDFYDSEVESWRESGQALGDAKRALAEEFKPDAQWANNALDKWRSERPADAPPAPSNKEILEVIVVEHDGEERHDPDITIDEGALKQLPEHDLNTLEAALIESFNGKAGDKAGDMDPPEYIEDNLDEQQRDVWDSMSDREKFRYASDQGLVEDIEDEDSDGGGEALDLNPTQEAMVRELLDEEDPKAIWALSDTAAGKQLLLGSDWNGEIDFHDKETMDRFNAYVGKVKAGAEKVAA